MPLDNSYAYQRYFFTVALTTTLIEIVGLFGFLLFILGDGYNTLAIFSVLAALGLFLNKPDLQEYLRICEALNTKSQST
jgi:preprotein translocase subunit Sss1